MHDSIALPAGQDRITPALFSNASSLSFAWIGLLINKFPNVTRPFKILEMMLEKVECVADPALR